MAVKLSADTALHVEQMQIELNNEGGYDDG